MIQEQFHKWNTQYLSRDFEMLVFGHAGYPVVIFPTSTGRYYEHKDFKMIEKLTPLIESGAIKVYCPDSIDQQSWLNKEISPADRVKTHIAYENVILYDVIKFAQYETGHRRVALAGCSFGGYHAANIAFKYPEKVAYMISLGGTYNIKQFLHGFYDTSCYYNNPQDYLVNLKDEWYLDRLRKMGIILGTGEWDICLQENINLSNILNSIGVQHWLNIRERTGHDWQFWHEMLPEYLQQLNQ